MKTIVKVHLSTLRPAILRWCAACVLALALVVGLAGEARAQQRVVALSGEGEVTRISLAIDSLSLGLSPDSVLSLSMRFSLLGDVLPREECVTLQPLLCTGVDTVFFAPVRVYGHWAHYHAVRGGDESAPISHTAV